MRKIISLEQAPKLREQFENEGKTIVLAGGCFDILHLGHLKFLEAAKKQGDILIICLESDENVKRLKGKTRPINPSKERATLLAALEVVDYVLILPELVTCKDYFNLVKYLKPDILAVTAGDPKLTFKKKQMKWVRGKVKVVIKPIETVSTSRLVKILGLD